MHGVGSWNSPIVISDDEDEAYVERELQLEQRLSSPRGYLGVGYDDLAYYEEEDDDAVDSRLWGMPRYEVEEAPEEDIPYGLSTSAIVGQKRKRTASDASYGIIPRPQPPLPVALPISGVPTLPSVTTKKESRKTKKRRKREEAERLRLAGLSATAQPGSFASRKAGPSMPITPLHPPPLATSNSYSNAPSIPFSQQPPPFSLPLKPLFVTPLSSLPPPVSLNSGFAPPPPLPMVHFNNQKLFTPKHIPMPEPGSSTLLTATPRLSHPAQLQPKGMIGRPPDEDTNSQHGTYSSPLKEPPPDPARTLIMELLPKKYRNVHFVRSWTMKFGPQHAVTLRIEMDAKAGKALIEFASNEIARTAFESPRIYGEGKEHIRVWWYKVPLEAVADRELEEGEIDEDREFHTHAKSKHAKLRLNKDVGEKRKPSQVHPSPPMSVQQPPPLGPTKDAAPHIPAARAMPPQSLTPSPSMPSPELIRQPLPARILPSQVLPAYVVPPPPELQSTPDFNDRATSMEIDSDDGVAENVNQSIRSIVSSRAKSPLISSRSEAPGHERVLKPAGALAATALPPALQDSPSPSLHTTEASLTAVSPASLSDHSPSPTLASASSTPPLEVLATKSASKSSNDSKQSLLARQKELEEKIARMRSDALTSHRAQEDTMMAHVQLTATATTTTSVAGNNSMAKEETLRQLVLKSKRTRVATTRAVSSHPSTVIPTEGVSLDDLAVSFITESIKAVSPSLSFAPSPQAVSPSPAYMTEKEILSTKQRLLEKHIADSKVLMQRLSAATSRVEKDRILKEMKTSTRAMEEEMKSLALASERIVRRSSGGFTPKTRWPETTSCVVIVSDDESDDDYD